jgi:hypothetical protein
MVKNCSNSNDGDTVSPSESTFITFPIDNAGGKNHTYVIKKKREMMDLKMATPKEN